MPDTGSQSNDKDSAAESRIAARTVADERAERLAAALRANLKRRKAADRARRSTAVTGAEPTGVPRADNTGADETGADET